MRLKSGLSALPEGRRPTMPTLAATPASMQASAIGATASSVALPASIISMPMPCLETMLGSEIRSMAPRITPPMRCTSPGPAEPIAMMPAISTTAPWRSVERATWPFSRASLRFLGVAFSVFSPAIRPPGSLGGRHRRPAAARW
jgi:hypothetical protein